MPSHRLRPLRLPVFRDSVPLPPRVPFVSSLLLFLLHSDSVPCALPCAGSMPVFFVPPVVTAPASGRRIQPIEKLSLSLRGNEK
jgi:hypothetical protein